MSRFRDVNRGPLLNQAYQRRLAYISRDISERNATANLGTRTTSPRVDVSVLAFGDLDANAPRYRVRTNQRNRTQLGTAIGTRADADDTSLGASILNPGFQPARIKLFVQTGRIVATSAITGIRYLKSQGQNYSHPFGRSSGTDGEFDAFNTIAAALAEPNRRITYSAEKLRGR